ncbi:MAG: DUF5606 domain-containing protein [Bacteroidetes bacterium]|nr:DUF5606 domain-containing protein [Bacteroidota bacterium]
MMDLSKILSISGKRGLFKVVSQLKNAVVVESLIDNKRFPAFPHEKISSLEEIAVFTTGEDIQLKEVLKKIYEKLEGKPAPYSKADDQSIKPFFIEVIPDYDQERVYLSDIWKIISWYNLLIEHNLLDFSEPEKKEDENEGEGKTEGEEKSVKSVTEVEEIKHTAPKKKKTTVVKSDAGKMAKKSVKTGAVRGPRKSSQS